MANNRTSEEEDIIKVFVAINTCCAGSLSDYVQKRLLSTDGNVLYSAGIAEDTVFYRYQREIEREWNKIDDDYYAYYA
jgi:hypothetical protein